MTSRVPPRPEPRRIGTSATWAGGVLRLLAGVTMHAACAAAAAAQPAEAAPAATIAAATASAPTVVPTATPILLTQARAVVSDADAFPADAPAVPVSLPDRWHDSRPRLSGSVWYRFEPTPRPTTASAQDMPALYIERACSGVEVQLNGHLVHTPARAGLPVARGCDLPTLVALPSALWREQGNVLDLRVQGHALERVASVQRAAGLSVLELGSHEALAGRHAVASFWRADAVRLGAVALLLLGGALMLLGWRRRQESPLWLFGALSLAWAAASPRIWLHASPVDNAVIEFLAASALAPAAVLAMLYLLRAVRFRAPTLEHALLSQCALVPLSMLIAGPNHLYVMSLAWYTALIVELLIVIGLHLWASWRQERPEWQWMAPILALSAGVLLYEPLTQFRLLPMPGAPVLQLAVTVLLLAGGASLLFSLARALQTSEAERRRLEQRVDDLVNEGENLLTELGALRLEKQRAFERRPSPAEQRETAAAERAAAQLAEARLERVTAQERKRIAADLHDDLGAKLLTIVHTSEDGQISTLAREALEEMRLSVRGLTGKPVRLTDAVADWRSETVARLSQAGIEADWRGINEDAAVQLPARSFVQTTRILREAVSNVIKHSGASQCKVRCGLREREFGLVVQDNGNGISLELDGKLDRGHGMAGMKNRAKQMQGQCLVESGPGYGTVIRLTIPL